MQPRNRATMSGQLVGEVIAASPTFQKRGLSERGFHALIATAEKCHTQTRQGSVGWDHIRDCLYGALRRTAQRAVHDLLTAGVLEIVKPGFGNQYGRTCAPIYQIAPLVDNDTWVAQSNKVDDDTQMSRSNEVDDDKSKVHDDKPGSGSRHPGVVLDRPIDGGVSPQPGTSPDESQPSTDPPLQKPFTEQQAADPEPPRHCPRHMPDGTDDNCGGCGIARRQHDAWKRRTVERLTALLDTIARQIDACDDCDRAGQLVYGPAFTPCPKHPNFRQPHIAAMRAKRNALREDPPHDNRTTPRTRSTARLGRTHLRRRRPQPRQHRHPTVSARCLRHSQTGLRFDDKTRRSARRRKCHAPMRAVRRSAVCAHRCRRGRRWARLRRHSECGWRTVDTRGDRPVVTFWDDSVRLRLRNACRDRQRAHRDECTCAGNGRCNS